MAKLSQLQSRSDAELLRFWVELFLRRQRLGFLSSKPPRIFCRCHDLNWEIQAPSADDNTMFAVCLTTGDSATLNAYQLTDVSLARP